MIARQPTVAEAVEILNRLITREFMREQFIYWREKYGEKWADEVRAKFKVTMKGKKANA